MAQFYILYIILSMALPCTITGAAMAHNPLADIISESKTMPMEPQPTGPEAPVARTSDIGLSHTIQLHLIPCHCDIADHTTDISGISCHRLINQAFQPWHAHGICVIYHGIYAFSDMHGYVTFAKDHPGTSIDIVVTPFIYPVLSKGQLVDHWNQAMEISHRMYHAVYTHPKDSDHAQWTITPFDQERIPDDALIILANPHDIIVPQGKIIAAPSHNLILPTLCLTHTSDHEPSAYALLKTLKYLRYIRPVHELKQLNHAFVLSYAPYRLMA
jgi:hypothetical protein